MGSSKNMPESMTNTGTHQWVSPSYTLSTIKSGVPTGDASRAPPVMWTTITASMAVHRSRSA